MSITQSFVTHRTISPMLLSVFPGSIELKKVLGGRHIGIISAELYQPVYKIDIVKGRVKIGTGPTGNPDVKELLKRYDKEELARLPVGMSIVLNGRYQVIAIDHTGDRNYDNYYLHSKLVPFPCPPVERAKDNKSKAILLYLAALPDAQFGGGRIGVLPESGNMIHLTGTSIAPMVFLSLPQQYRKMLKEVPADGFEALVYYAMRKSLPELADLLIGTERFGPENYVRHIPTWL